MESLFGTLAVAAASKSSRHTDSSSQNAQGQLDGSLLTGLVDLHSSAILGRAAHMLVWMVTYAW
jgi:hypothetical protein